MRTIIEPFRTKTVEPITFTSRNERVYFLQEARYNLFQLKAAHVIIDLLTDSGTSAMSSNQWSAMMKGDESYAGCSSFFQFERSVKKTFGFPVVLPVHQGRAAERILFEELVGKGQLVPSNTHFDTTRANIEEQRGQAVDLPQSNEEENLSDQSFKGNIDIRRLERMLSEDSAKVALIMLTVTNNANGGHPVSLANIQETSRLAHRFKKPFFIDAARFAENAYLIKLNESNLNTKSLNSIVHSMFELADGCTMSAKKDGLCNMGGFIGLRDQKLAQRLIQRLIITEGFQTYGGLSGRDLEAIAVGLEEVLKEDYLRYRHSSASYIAKGLKSAGVPILEPHAMHAIYIDCRKFLPHIKPSELPGQVLACELYLEAGIRSCEIGTAMFGKINLEGKQEVAAQDLVRLALPRRVYSQSHYDYVIEACENVYRRRHTLSGMRISSQSPKLRHFTASYEPILERDPKTEKELTYG